MVLDTLRNSRSLAGYSSCNHKELTRLSDPHPHTNAPSPSQGEWDWGDVTLVSMEREEAGSAWAPWGRGHVGGRCFAVISRFSSVFEKSVLLEVHYLWLSVVIQTRFPMFIFYQGEHFGPVCNSVFRWWGSTESREA